VAAQEDEALVADEAPAPALAAARGAAGAAAAPPPPAVSDVDDTPLAVVAVAGRRPDARAALAMIDWRI
jgi:hypothetical protein